jgi:soluble lytic murein transglycosylase
MRRGISAFLWVASIGGLAASASVLLPHGRAALPGSRLTEATPSRTEALLLQTEASLSRTEAHLAARLDRPDGILSRSVAEPTGQDLPASVRPEAGHERPDAPPEPGDILARQSASDLAAFTAAIKSYKSGELGRGDVSARAVEAPILRTALEWIALRKSPRKAGFERLQVFAAAHPDWPGLPWLQKRSEEALLGDRPRHALVKAYFARTHPRTPAGKLALARVLTEEGDGVAAGRLVRSVWREDDIDAWLEARIRANFGRLLERADHKYRADRLLYKPRQAAAAMRAAKLAGADVLALAKARASVNAEAPSSRLMAAVPPALRADPGYLFARIQTLRRGGKVQEAADLLLAAPRDKNTLIDGDAWWVERRLVARKVLDLGEARNAYRICADHAAETDPMVIEAEFHAGWIALRFLNDPALAAAHFATAAGVAKTPISRARVAYWQGRAEEAASGDSAPGRARAFYEAAAAHPATYYGQLARAALHLASLPIRSIPDEARGDERAEAVRVIDLLYALDETDVGTQLVTESARHLTDSRQVAALATLVAARQDARLSLSVGKIASQRGFALDTLAFPAFGVPDFVPLRNSVPASIVYSIARQESAFDAKAVSPAGAKGLMQMMTATARSTAARAAVAFNETRLVTDPAFNAQLGAAHLGDLIDEHRGSCILAFAAYNAGGGRVKEWVEAYGDPRRPDVDPVDWVERIPFTETRNYVQRVTENLQVYRARFGEPAASPFERFSRIEAKL